MPQTTPRAVARIGRRVFLASFPVAVAVPATWAAQLIPDHKPYLVLMVFMLALATAMVAATAWALALCHLSIARAFAAGVQAGQVHHHPPSDRKVRLQVVD